MTTTPTSVRSRRRLLTRTVLLALLALALAACSTPDDKAPDTRMVPWRGADGQFGFSTRDEQLLIEPRFQTARPGNHGFAPVATAKDR